MQNYTENANEHKMCAILSFFEFEVRTCSFFTKMFLIYDDNVNQLCELTRDQELF